MNQYTQAIRLPLAGWLTPAELDRNPERQFTAALAACGCFFRRDGDELVYRSHLLEARLTLADAASHSVLKFTVTIPEARLLVGASALLDEMAADGLPVVAMGYGRGSAMWEFRWVRAAGHPWRAHADRCVEIIDRLRTAIRR